MTVRRRLPAPARSVVAVGSAALLVVAVAAVVAGVMLPRLAGGTPHTVLSGSMQPELSPGDLVVTRPVAVEDVRVGSVVTYQLRSGEPVTVTHRVVGLTRSPRGEPLLVTRGDANGAPDPEPVRAPQLRGELWYAVPALGHVASWGTAEQRTLITRLVAGGLLVYAAVTVVGAHRRRERERRETAPGETAWSESEPAEHLDLMPEDDRV